MFLSMIKGIKGFFGKRSALLTFAVAALALALPMSAFASPPSNVIDFSTGTGFGFSLMDIVNSAWSFIGQFDTYTIFILALILVPTLVGFVIWIVSKAPKFNKKSA